MGKLMLLVEGSAYRPSSWVIPLSSFFAASLFIDDEVFCFLEEEAWCAAGSARGVTMAVALATLPLNRVLAGAGDTCFAAATGAGLAAVFAAGVTAFAAGLAAGRGAGLAAGLVATTGLAITLAGFTTGFAAALRFLAVAGLPLLAATLLEAGFFATTLAGGAFLTATFLMAPFLATTFLATTFFGAGALAGLDFFTGDLATGLPTAFFGADFFATGLLAGLAAAFGFALATVFDAALAGVLLAFFTDAPLPAAVVDLPALVPDEALPLCALAAVELRVVFAISLHR